MLLDIRQCQDVSFLAPDPGHAEHKRERARARARERERERGRGREGEGERERERGRGREGEGEREREGGRRGRDGEGGMEREGLRKRSRVRLIGASLLRSLAIPCLCVLRFGAVLGWPFLAEDMGIFSQR